jgi:hypothetical protein
MQCLTPSSPFVAPPASLRPCSASMAVHGTLISEPLEACQDTAIDPILGQLNKKPQFRCEKPVSTALCFHDAPGSAAAAAAADAAASATATEAQELRATTAGAAKVGASLVRMSLEIARDKDKLRAQAAQLKIEQAELAKQRLTRTGDSSMMVELKKQLGAADEEAMEAKKQRAAKEAAAVQSKVEAYLAKVAESHMESAADAADSASAEKERAEAYLAKAQKEGQRREHDEQLLAEARAELLRVRGKALRERAREHLEAAELRANATEAHRAERLAAREAAQLRAEAAALALAKAADANETALAAAERVKEEQADREEELEADRAERESETIVHEKHKLREEKETMRELLQRLARKVPRSTLWIVGGILLMSCACNLWPLYEEVAKKMRADRRHRTLQMGGHTRVRTQADGEDGDGEDASMIEMGSAIEFDFEEDGV